jgi:hypothetical protein
MLLLALVGCSAEDRRSPPPAQKASPSLAHGTQADLGHELDEAAKHGTWIELRRRWQGQKLRWTVTRQQLLCSSEDACNVRAFPTMQPATHGWMPEVKWAPGQYEAMVAKCGQKEQCEITIEGVLAKLEASDESPTRLRFDGVVLVERT